MPKLDFTGPPSGLHDSRNIRQEGHNAIRVQAAKKRDQDIDVEIDDPSMARFIASLFNGAADRLQEALAQSEQERVPEHYIRVTEVYFSIAAEILGEEEVRRRRDLVLAKIEHRDNHDS